MNNINLIQIAQQSFRVTVGAATSLVETVQNPQKRTELLSQMQSDFSQKTQEWSEKGETTEHEARKFLETMLSNQNFNTGSSNAESSSTMNQKSTASELQQLTDEIISLRKELEQMRQTKK